jgi:hypothetical protein
VIPRDEWRRRYIERFVTVCVKEAEAPMTMAQALAMGEADFEACEFEEIHRGYEDDPEGSADESMSYYTDDG